MQQRTDDSPGPVQRQAKADGCRRGQGQQYQQNIQRARPVQRPAIRPVGARQADIEPATGLNQPFDAKQPRITVTIDQISVKDGAVAEERLQHMHETDYGQHGDLVKVCVPCLRLFIHRFAPFPPYPYGNGFP